MSQTVLHLLKHNIDGEKGLRYLNVRISNDVNIITPLFFGTDLLNNSGMNSSNHCRIHTRYAKSGLASKLIFPSDVTISGLTHCLNGAWFYSLQGVFQVIFEHQSRKIQLKIVTSLLDMWQGVEADPKLPRRLSVTLGNLQPTLEESFLGNKTKVKISIVVDSTTSNSETNCSPENRGEKEVLQKRTDSSNFQRLSSELLERVEKYAECCSTDEKCLIGALISFIRLIYRDSKFKIGQVFSSFLEIITAYSDVVKLDSKLTTSDSMDWMIDENEDTLLNLVGIWLGKNLNEFKDMIAKKVDVFKVENFCLIDDLPSAPVLVPRLFPDCMRLLIGYWIGLYGSPPSLPSAQDASAANKLGDRQDHSYSSSVQAVKLSCGKREDHSYSTSNPTLITTTTTWLETVPISLQFVATQPTRDDHTYVHHENTGEIPTELPKTRKDHTYVSTKEPKPSKPSGQSVNTGLPNIQISQVACNVAKTDETPAAKRLKSVPSCSKSDSCVDAPYIADPSKHPFVLLILEFLNNVLISGIGHVVYSRLIQTN